MLIIRLIEWENNQIHSVYEMQRYHSNGRKNSKRLEQLLDLAEGAIKAGRTPKFEFKIEN